MQSNEAYERLLAHIKKTTALEQAAGLLSWDQETMMPPSGAEARSEQLGALSSVIHFHRTDPKIGDWLSDIDVATLDPVATANIREVKRSFDRNTKVPAALAEELAKETALSQGIWAKARGEDSFSDFAPTLQKILELKREEAACICGTPDQLYDALLEDYEPGMKSAPLQELLGKLRLGLIDLRQKIEASGKKIPEITGGFSESQQMEMANRLATVFNYDWRGGRIDKAVHPFSSGYRSDSRITTRTSLENPFDCLYSTVHEVGHSNYEQGRDPSMDRTPAGGYASMGMHESQSRMLENQIGRSRPFMEWLFPQMVEVFGDMNVNSPDELFAAVNRVERGYIRTDADEVHYNLHVLLRFDLELALINNDLQVNDLEAAWNDRYYSDFGQKIQKASQGVLQDVHWSCGLFGYFPTYSLGNLYAAEQFAVMETAIPNRDALIEKGDLTPLTDWLTENIHRSGNVKTAPDLMKSVTGKSTSEETLVGYLNDKFLRLYPH